MAKYIIGVDGGSQSSKVVIYDLEGNAVAMGRQKLRPMSQPRPGIVEHPDDDLWESLQSACRQAMSSFSGNPRDIIGLALCTIRFCRVLLREDGNLAAPVMSWMDDRVSRPYEHVNPQVRYVTTTSGYITHRLTGQFRDTAANYQGQWPIDTDTWSWSEDAGVIGHYHLSNSMLFTLCMPGEVLGTVTQAAAEATGLPVGIPVVATANDKAVEALGSGTIGNSTALVSLGTYIAAMVHGTTNRKNGQRFWTNFASVPHRYLYESFGIRRGMWTISWFADLLNPDAMSSYRAVELQLDAEAAQLAPGSDGLVCILDWLAPVDEPFKRGAMLGFHARHTRGHMYRSILEGIAMTMKNKTADMSDELGVGLERLVLSGGGSKSDLMTQIFADVFGLPVSRNVVADSASLGAAICVAVALGEYSSFEEAVSHMVRPKPTVYPNVAHQRLYERLNTEVYRSLTTYTDEILKRMHAIFG